PRYLPLFPYTTLFRSFIWNNQSGMAGEFKEFFFNRENCPYLRITEVYLMHAEALLHEDKIQEALTVMTLLSTRSGYAQPSVGVRSEEHTSELQSRENL